MQQKNSRKKNPVGNPAAGLTAVCRTAYNFQ
jgi:hypothetical protein